MMKATRVTCGMPFASTASALIPAHTNSDGAR
jgi:hypothetical protein